ncbi:MAG: hypothetical protein MMC23_005495 [Stictis urceolatum]|nr:hypothetical protein [Stictis urceolata]
MEGPPVALLVILLIFFLVAPETPRANTPHQQHELNLLFEKEHHALDVLNTTSYGDFDPIANKYLNISGFRKEDGYAWDRLPQVRARVLEQMDMVLKPWAGYDLGERYASVATLDGDLDNIRGNPIVASIDAVPFYQNITGLIHGQWVRSKINDERKSPVLNITELSPHISYITSEYNRNITGKEGDLSFKLDEKKSKVLRMGSSSVREVRAEMTIKDETSSGDGWDLTLHGLHFPESGGVLLTTTGDKFDGIFALPHLARSEATSLLAKELLDQTIGHAIAKQEAADSLPPYPWAAIPNNPADLMFPTPHCEFVVYMQQNIIWPHSAGPPFEEHGSWPTYLERLEEELRFPTGASFSTVRNMEFSVVIFSPDCGFVLESKGPPDFSPATATHLHGPKTESFYKSVRALVQALAFLIACQIWLLIRQMKDASTPSTRSRISFYTIAIMALGDGFVFLSFMAVTMLTDAVFLVIAGTSFLAFLSVSFFGMKFLIDIWTVQAPERLERERERDRVRRENAPQVANPTNAAATSNTPTSTDTLPLPVTARRPIDTGATPIIIPSDQDLDAEIEEVNTNSAPTTQTTTQADGGSTRREMGTMYSRFYFLLIGILFLSLNATTWPTTLRSIYTNLLAFSYLSFWLPQIRRNIMRNCRKALRWEFVVGQSVLRFMPIYYFYTYTDNIFFAKTDSRAMFALAAWLWVQVWALVSQEILGPRFFVPSGWAPPAYDYHPALREDDEESGARMPLGFTQATIEGEGAGTTMGEKRGGRKVFDCAICMQDIDVPVVGQEQVEGEDSAAGGGAGTGITANLFGRRAYMVTPSRVWRAG